MNSGLGSSDEDEEPSQSSDSNAQSSIFRKQQYDDSDPLVFEENEDAKKSLWLSVSVSDTGVGMNEEMKKKCFMLFGNLKFK